VVKLLADAAFNGTAFDAVLAQRPDLDLIRVQDVGLRTAPDPVILEWAATTGRVLLTHDRQTMPGFAYDRVRARLPMPGVIVLRDERERIGVLVEAVLLVALCSEQAEWIDRVEFNL
jgi:predicted nuclease of predicted toxin-antitoxin system